MVRILMGLVLVVGISGAARAQDDGAAIRGVISDQIAAFEQDDFAAAFEYTSPGIRQMFGTS